MPLITATSDSWQCKPFVAGLPIPYTADFDAAQTARLAQGLIPREMEDKWFMYFEAPYLYLHRSWTGHPGYRVQLESTSTGSRVLEALLAVEPGDTSTDGLDYEAQLLDFLISNLLLDAGKPFPLPEGVHQAMPGLLQHHIAGTGYPEQTRSAASCIRPGK